MATLRLAGPDDFAAVWPRTQALNAHEAIDIPLAVFEGALRTVLGDPALGAAWLVEVDGAVVGYALTTYSYDLEFHGREAWLTELWIDEVARGGGIAREVLDLLAAELRGRGIGALHLQVRPDNPAQRLYARAGFVASPRIVMTRRLG